MVFKGINYKYEYKAKSVYSGKYYRYYSNVYYEQFALIDGEYELLECHVDCYGDGDLIPQYTF